MWQRGRGEAGAGEREKVPVASKTGVKLYACLYSQINRATR